MNTVPPWLKKRIVLTDGLLETKKALSLFRVNTVCESGACPNLNECFSRKFATFMILGKSCTRACSFCSVEKGAPETPDADEPRRISECARRLGLKHVIITSVTRDDLADGGAGHFVKTVDALRRLSGAISIELLIPDLAGKKEGLGAIAASRADIIGHNIETVKRLYPEVRKSAVYSRSLGVLRFIKDSNPGKITKSSLMVGMGEREEEVVAAMRDIRDTGCDILAIGQYLSPTGGHHRVERFVTPAEFDRYKDKGAEMGFRYVSSGPFVRSSYRAEEESSILALSCKL